MSQEVDQTVLEGLRLRLFQLYVMFGTPTGDWDINASRVQDVLAAHVEWLRGLEGSGTMFMGGPFRAADYEWDGSGMIVVRAESLAQATEIAHQDPLYTEGLRTYELRGWQLNEGRLNLSIDLDANRVELA